METQLVILLALTAVTLTANTLAVWYVYRTFAQMAGKVTDTLHEISAAGAAREWILSLDRAASRTALATANAKACIESFEPALVRAQDVYGYRLAKVDKRFETLCDTIVEKTERAQDAILRPATRIGMMVSGVQSVIDLTSSFRREASIATFHHPAHRR